MYTHHIRKRNNKNSTGWQIVIEGERDPTTGKRDRHYKTIKGTKKEAQAEAIKMVNELSSGGIIKASTIKLKDWLLEWHSVYLPDIEYRTRESYLYWIEHRINPSLGSTPLKALQTTIIQKWINSLASELAPKTVRNIFNILNASLNKAVVLKKIPFNPCVGIVLPKRKKYQAQTYTVTEMQQALALAEGTDMYLILLLDFSLGVRRGELLALTWDDVNFNKSEITINKSTYNEGDERKEKAPKTESGIRTISIGDTLLQELKRAHVDYLERKLLLGARFVDSNLIICKKDGSAYHTDSMSNKWKRFIKKHNLRKIRFHDIRHTNATMLIAAGIDIKTVQARLGHSDISTTMNIYTHVTPEMNANAAKKIDDIISA